MLKLIKKMYRTVRQGEIFVKDDFSRALSGKNIYFFMITS